MSSPDELYLIWSAFVALGIAGTGGIIAVQRRRAEAYRQAMRAGGCIMEESWTRRLRAVKRAGDVRITIMPVGGGKLPTRWQLTASPVRVTDAAAFRIRLETTVGRIKNVLGLPDVRVGGDAFDDRFRVIASDVARARAQLGDVRVQWEVNAFFMLADAFTELKFDALQLTAQLPRRGLDAADALRRMDALLRLSLALHEHARQPPQFTDAAPLRESSGRAVTGSPLAVPLSPLKR